MKSAVSAFALSALLLSAANPPASAQKVEELLKEQVDAARKALVARWEEFEGGKTGGDEMAYLWSKRLMEAERAAKNADAEHKHWQRMVKLEEIVAFWFESGKATVSMREGARFYRVEAEIWAKKAAKKQ